MPSFESVHEPPLTVLGMASRTYGLAASVLVRIACATAAYSYYRPTYFLCFLYFRAFLLYLLSTDRLREGGLRGVIERGLISATRPFEIAPSRGANARRPRVFRQSQAGHGVRVPATHTSEAVAGELCGGNTDGHIDGNTDASPNALWFGEQVYVLVRRWKVSSELWLSITLASR